MLLCLWTCYAYGDTPCVAGHVTWVMVGLLQGRVHIPQVHRDQRHSNNPLQSLRGGALLLGGAESEPTQDIRPHRSRLLLRAPAGPLLDAAGVRSC
ncbi:hypothetical protein HaLaN_19557 [Haematococcus lacustris]|uniref:Secreted protein n=1 Tax=Haematococcus lacustris TaxID=44745 RepID=A0A699ZR36_HAELA|nr:hypothetical protein HaLaN_19557 [Haematococcus lacustris]